MSDTVPKPVKVLLMRMGPIFIVKSISNTTLWKPGDQVTHEVVQTACKAPGWDVTMVDNDILQNLLGAAAGGLTHTL